MENRDDEFYGPKDLLSPATREEFLYIKSDVPAHTGLIEDSPAVAIGLQHDRNQIFDWLKANLPPLILVLGIVSLTFTGHWNRVPEYSGIPILENYTEDTVEQKTLIPPNEVKKEWGGSFLYDPGKLKHNSERYSRADKSHITPISKTNNKTEVSNNLITMEQPLKIHLLQQGTFTITLNAPNNCGSDHFVDSFWILESPILKADTLSILNYLTFLDLKSNNLTGWVDYNYTKDFSSINKNYLSYYDKKGLHFGVEYGDYSYIDTITNKSIIADATEHISPQELSLLRPKLNVFNFDLANNNKTAQRSRLVADSIMINIAENALIKKSNIACGVEKPRYCSLVILNECVSGYRNTTKKMKNNSIIYLSTHGTITNEYCKISFSPTGIKKIEENTSPDCTPLDPNYNLGALLFRIGENDTWKPYTGDNMPLKVDKPGVLEFTINLKSTKNIKGNYQVLAYEKVIEEDRK